MRNQLRWVSHTVAAFATLTHFVCGCGSLLATLTHFVCGCGSLFAALTHFVCGCGSLLATLTHFMCGCGSLLAQAHPSLTFGFANHRRLRMVAGWKHLYLWSMISPCSTLYCVPTTGHSMYNKSTRRFALRAPAAGLIIHKKRSILKFIDSFIGLTYN